MEMLRGAIRGYPWGSRTAIAELTNRPTPSSGPEAEMWLGAHPGDPAWLTGDAGERSLLELLGTDPERLLGPTVCARFGPELPFLMKVIAAEAPLSLQAHPNSAQACAGFELEEGLGLAASASTRNYRDRRHKPEIVIALSQFEALAGFRPVAETRRLLRALAFYDHDGVLGAADHPGALRELFTLWMTAPQRVVEKDLRAVLQGAAGYLSIGDVEFEAECQTLMELGTRYPGDRGILAALLLNRISLRPGDALFLPAGNLHAYLRGVAIEVMANSDNVLRGGLTSKHVDVPELLRILEFTPTEPAHLRPAMWGDGPRCIYSPPVDEFAVTVWTLGDNRFGHEVTALDSEHGPHIFLCTQGSVTLRDAHGALRLQRGEAAWVSHLDRPVRLVDEGRATVFAAGLPAA